MYVIGDKYDIPGLKSYSCAYLGELFTRVNLPGWHYDIAIWSLAYEHSRESDELRQVLMEQVCEALLHNYVIDIDSFIPFLAKSPELLLPLLRMTLERHSADPRKCSISPFGRHQESN